MSVLPLPTEAILVTWCPGGPCDPCDCAWRQYTDDEFSDLDYITGLDPWDPERIYGPDEAVEYSGLPFVAGAAPVPGVTPISAPDQWTLQDLTLYDIDQPQSFCGAPFWGVGAIADGVTDETKRGDLVDGFVTLFLIGQFAVKGDPVANLPTHMSAFPPASKVIYQGEEIFVFDPALGSLIGFSAGYDIVTPFEPNGGVGFDAGGILPITRGGWQGTARVPVTNCLFLDPAVDDILGDFNCVLPYMGPIPDPSLLSDITPATPSVDSAPVFFGGLYSEFFAGPPPHGGDFIEDLSLRQEGTITSPLYFRGGHAG